MINHKKSPVTGTFTDIKIKGEKIEGSILILAWGNRIDFQIRNMTKKQSLRLILKIIKEIF